uniref:Uncharacterized protein n=1 Tax=Ditylenchus dipsaci TaxID=166011 RepID=A0A915E8G6_9BILA
MLCCECKQKEIPSRKKVAQLAELHKPITRSQAPAKQGENAWTVHQETVKLREWERARCEMLELRRIRPFVSSVHGPKEKYESYLSFFMSFAGVPRPPRLRDGLRIQEKTATDLDSMKSEIKNQGQRTQDTIRDIEKQMQKLMQKQKQMLTFMDI